MAKKRGPPKSATMRVEPFVLKLKGPGDLHAVFEKAAQLPEDSPLRDVELREYRVRLDECARNPWGQWEGDVTRIRTDRFPSVVPPTGKAQPLRIGDDHNLGESTAFLFDPRTCAILIQLNRDGVSPSGVVDFLRRLGPLPDVELQAIIHLDALRRLMESRTIKKFEIALAGANAGIFANEMRPLQSFMRMAREFNAPAIRVEMHVTEKRATLLPSLKEMLRDLVTNTPRDVDIKSLCVVGTDSDYNSFPIDLLKERLTYEVTVYFDHDRRLPFETRKQGLREAWGFFERSPEAPKP